MKKIVLGVFIGLLISSGVVYATTLIDSKDVTYTPSDNEFDVSDVESALNELYDKINAKSNNPISIDIYRGIQTIIEVNADEITFTANGGTNSYASTYPTQWYIAGSNDLSNWTELFNYSWSSNNAFSNTYTVNIGEYKYIRFGSGNGQMNYMTVASFNNIVFN